MTFYLGTHQTHWLAKAGVPLFISSRRLVGRRGLPRAQSEWCLDSGAFSELSMFGKWTVTAARYARQAERFGEAIGRMRWASIQDWMCEPFIINKTRKTIKDHQKLTIESLHNLRQMAPAVPWAPILQGYRVDDYLDHVEQYEASGVRLASEPSVGVGSVCKRQSTDEVYDILGYLFNLRLRLHGFGLKIGGLARCAGFLASADSMAWSFEARRLQRPLPGCKGHKNCANCLRYALLWRGRVLESATAGSQVLLNI